MNTSVWKRLISICCHSWPDHVSDNGCLQYNQLLHPIFYHFWTQQGTRLLEYAAASGDLSIFECLVEHGAVIGFNDRVVDEVDESDIMVASMLQRRQDWIHQATGLALQWRVPLSALRVVHGYVVGFNWSAVSEAFSARRIASVR